jgi:hypothetical protein
MPDVTSPSVSDPSTADRLAQFEARLARIETHLGLTAGPIPTTLAPSPAATETAAAPSEVVAAPAATTQQAADDLELEVGQTWFASVGILVFALGGGFMLTLPYPGLPAAAPSLVGLAAAAGLFFVAHRWERAFELVAGYLRGAGMALLFCATLRLFFFGAQPALSITSPVAPALLALAVALNLTIALRRNSPWLTALALATGSGSVLALGSAWWALGSLTALATLTAIMSLRRRWPAVALVGFGLIFFTYALWAVGNPVRGGAFHFVTEPPIAPAFMLLYAIGFGALPLFRPAEDADDPFSIAGALAACAIGYGIFLIHTAATGPKTFAGAHLGASALFLALAVVFWTRRHSYAATFFYAMTGYAALSMAIIKLAASPDVFVWLSLQSVMVVTTAIWFRSRSIVVANFLIYVAVVLAYVVVKERETGISLGFGVVALVSARILNWQKHRLELKTELMRNAYLLSAFTVFPYALLHLVPVNATGLAWIGMAGIYYVLNFVVRNRKYRWMGHGTLLLTAVYLVVAGGRQLAPAWRVATFLMLGAALLVVSLTFTRLRRRELASRA